MSDNELSVTRYIDAPPAKVWQILTERQNEWWCPRPWRAEVDEQDRRAGGVCNMTFHGPDGEAMPQNRSEEHTSELQSLMRLSFAVFCLKKKQFVFERFTLIPLNSLN